MAETSSGEQTIAFAPASIEFFASEIARSRGLLSIPMSFSMLSLSEVRTVTAVISISGAPFAAALII